MTAHTPKRPPVVRLPPKSNFELLLSRGSQIAMLFVGLLAFIFALELGRFLLAPVALAVVVGLMLGPLATRLERRGIRPGLSAVFVTFLFIFLVVVLVGAVAAPMALWAERIPSIWNELQVRLLSFREPLEIVRNLREQLQEFTGDGNVTVAVEDGSAIESVAALAPAIVAQFLLFFASLYFFVATRHQTRLMILGMCFNRKLRWRVAHIFRDVETLVSRYLLSITVINVGLGVAVTAALWIVGVPSPFLWGAMATLLNFVIYIGPAVMAAILFGVGLVAYDTLSASLMPPAVFLALNMVEAQFVTPMVIGRAMTLNPFVVFLALAFWLWIWGPVGGLVAIPALLVVYAISRNILPGLDWGPTR